MKSLFKIITNIWMYSKFFFFKFIIEVLILFPIGFLLYWLAYIFKKSIQWNPGIWKIFILWWIVNSDEDNYIDNWWGVYEMIDDEVDEFGNVIKDKYAIFNDMGWIRKFRLSYEWGVFRNWTWNTKVALGKLLIPEHSIDDIIKTMTVHKKEGLFPVTTWRNNWIFGIQSITYKLGRVKHFRYSFTLPLDRVWLGGFLRILKRGDHYNLMIGSDFKRYLFKSRLFYKN